MPPAPRKLVVFSGVGLSADGGVPTYRVTLRQSGRVVSLRDSTTVRW